MCQKTGMRLKKRGDDWVKIKGYHVIENPHKENLLQNLPQSSSNPKSCFAFRKSLAFYTQRLRTILLSFAFTFLPWLEPAASVVVDSKDHANLGHELNRTQNSKWM